MVGQPGCDPGPRAKPRVIDSPPVGLRGRTRTCGLPVPGRELYLAELLSGGNRAGFTPKRGLTRHGRRLTTVRGLVGRAPVPTPARDAGGSGRGRTDGLLLAKQALSQLSYEPALKLPAPDSYRSRCRNLRSVALHGRASWLQEPDSNRRPPGYEPGALPTAPSCDRGARRDLARSPRELPRVRLARYTRTSGPRAYPGATGIAGAAWENRTPIELLGRQPPRHSAKAACYRKTISHAAASRQQPIQPTPSRASASYRSTSFRCLGVTLRSGVVTPWASR